MNLDPSILMRKPKRKSTTNIEDLSRTKKKRREPRRLTTEQLVERERKRKEKQKLKARQDAVEGLQVFNKFIRDSVTKEGQKGLIVVIEKILNSKSSIATENDQKRTKKLHNALTNDANSIFYATSQITKDLIRKEKNSVYEKNKLFLICMII